LSNTVLFFGILEAWYLLRMGAGKSLNNSGHTRIAILVALLGTRMANFTRVLTGFVTLLFHVITVSNMTYPWTNVSTRHRSLTFSETATFWRELDHFIDLNKE